MTQKQKNGIIFILGSLTAIGPFSIDMYLPGFPNIAKDLKTDISHVTLSLTSYFLGISFGQLIYGPLLDRFGRKKPLIIGLVIYFIAAIGCAFSPDIYTLIGLRLLLALGGCVGMVASRAVVRDLFQLNETVNAFSMLMLVMGISPIIAPTIGGFISASFGWRFIFMFLIIFVSLLLFMVIFFLPESKASDQTVSLKAKDIFKKYIAVIKEPSFLSYGIAGGIAYSGMFAYISGSSFLYMSILGFSSSQFGILFGLNAFGLILGSQLNRILLKKIKSHQIVLIASSLLFITGIFLVLSNYFFVNKYLEILILIFIFLFLLGFLNPNTTALALHPFNNNVGSASALMGSIQMFSGAVASALVSRLDNGTAAPMFLVMAGCATFSFIIINSRFILNHIKNKAWE